MKEKREIRDKLDSLFEKKGYQNYQWIDLAKIIVSQWVRMKCMYGCPAYGKIASCPPNVPSVEECDKFFKEYSLGVIFHFPKQMDDPDKQKAFVIKDKCKGCGLCIIACKPNALTYIIVRPPEYLRPKPSDDFKEDQPKPEFPVWGHYFLK